METTAERYGQKAIANVKTGNEFNAKVFAERAAHEAAKLLKRRASRRERDQAMKDLGLTRVRGAMGGIYYE